MTVIPFHDGAEALTYRNAFLDAFEAKCKILKIKIRCDEDEITQVYGEAECVNEDFDPALDAAKFLAEVLSGWMRVANIELCHKEELEDGYAVKRNPNAPS